MNDALARAVADHRAGRLDEAARAYRAMLEADPHDAEALHLLALVAHQTGSTGEAVRLLRRALEIAPGHDAARFNLGAMYEARGEFEAAIAAYQRVAESQPGRADVFAGLGNCYRAAGRDGEALDAYDRALTIDASSESALAGRAAVLAQMRRFDESADALLKAAALANDSLAAQRLRARASILAGQGCSARREFAAAQTHYEAALAMDPASPDAYVNLGAHAYLMGDAREAIAHARRAVALDPLDARAHFNLGVSSLLAGEFEEGWREFEWRSRDPRRARDYRYESFPRWNGGPFAGRVLVAYEQGFGDLLFVARYLPEVARLGGEVLVETPRELEGVIGRIPGVRAVRYESEPFALQPGDAYVPMFSLPSVFGTRADSIPSDAPYLRADQERVRGWAQRLALSRDALNAGIVWAGGSVHALDFVRSARLADFAPLASVAGVRWFSLQLGGAAAEISAGAFPVPLEDLGGAIRDFDDSAAILDRLDLVIAVDTSIVHLAGALARPVWTLLGLGTDWRWGTARSDSPWYPAMRLFRQRAPGRWDGAILEVRDALARLVAANQSR